MWLTGTLLALPALACGQVATQVGAELPAEAGFDAATMIDATPVCQGGDLSNTGTNDFRVSFVVVTSQSEFAALMNQRSVCAHSVYWDIRMTSSGLLAVETDDTVNYMPLTTVGARVNDGLLHDVVVQRAAGTLTVSVDGANTGSARSLSSLGKLPPLRIGSDVCTAATDGTMTFVGSITNVCVANY